MNTAATITVHPFEAAKLGVAPFRYVGMFSLPSASLAAQNVDAYNNALASIPRDIGAGSCCYCGMYITHNFIIKSSCGRRFVVGCECVTRTGDAGLVKEVKAERSKMAKEKREAKARIKRADREAAYKAVREARAADFVIMHAAVIERAAKWIDNNPFIKDVINGGVSGRYVSDKAIAAVVACIANLEQRAMLKANSRHTGTIGKRQEFTVTVERVYRMDVPSFRGYGYDVLYIITMRDDAGNAIVSKSTSFYADKGETFKMKATVKDHGSYDGEQQTIVQRIKRAA